MPAGVCVRDRGPGSRLGAWSPPGPGVESRGRGEVVAVAGGRASHRQERKDDERRDLPRAQPGREPQGGPEALRSGLGTLPAAGSRRSRLGCPSVPGEHGCQGFLHAGQSGWLGKGPGGCKVGEPALFGKAAD